MLLSSIIKILGNFIIMYHFPKETIAFINDLSKNNNKDWFNENRYRYENDFLTPSKEIVTSISTELKKINPNINCIPKVDGSIFRIYRDARRHKGKPPFKTHLGLIFWQGESRTENASYYLHIEPPFYYTGVGMAYFSPYAIKSFRNAVTNIKTAKELRNILDLAKKEYWQIEGDTLKKIPKGYTPLKNFEDLLLYKSLYLSDEMPINNDFYSNNFFTRIIEIYQKMTPYYNWLHNVVKEAQKLKLKDEMI